MCCLLTPNYISVTSKTFPVSSKVGTSPFGCLQWDTVSSSESGCLKHGSCCFIAPEVCFSLLLPYLGKFPPPVQSPKPKPGCLTYLFPHCPPSDPPELLNLSDFFSLSSSISSSWIEPLHQWLEPPHTLPLACFRLSSSSTP